MIEQIIDYVSNHKDILEYTPFAIVFPVLAYGIYRAIKEQNKQLQGILMDKDVDYLTRLKTKGIITIHEDKLKPYDLERLASTKWSKEKGIVRVKK